MRPSSNGGLNLDTETDPKAVLFDLDNTLVHRAKSTQAYAKLFVKTFKNDCRKLTEAATYELIRAEDLDGSGPANTNFSTIKDAIAHKLAVRIDWKVARSEQELYDHWVEFIPKCSVEMEGASSEIKRLLSLGYRVGILSNGAQGSRQNTAQSLSFYSDLAVVLSSGQFGINKPDTRLFNIALEQIGVSAEDCWYVGDNPVNDIQGAESAGIKAVFLEGFMKPIERPERCIQKLSQLSQFIT